MELESGHPLDVVRKLFPAHMSSSFMAEHGQFWGRVFEVTPDHTPDPLAFVLFRGGGKSTTAEAAAVVLVGQERRSFGLYVSGTQLLANKHVASVQGMLESDPIQQYYPGIGRPKIGITGLQRAWRTGAGSQAELQCENGASILAVGLDTAVRGLKLEHRRPDFIILDELDDRHDSPEAVKKNIEALTSNILPMRAPGCWVLFVQNMIHDYSIMTGVVRGDIKLLSNRELIGPVPAVWDCEIEHGEDREDGRDVITAGRAAWPERLPLEECQRIIDEETLEAFLGEYQHEVDRMKAGAVYPTWNEAYHISTWDELCDAIGDDEVLNEDGEVTLSDDWKMLIGLDWGATMGHRTVASLWATPPQRLDVYGIQDIWFRVGEICRPRTEADMPDMTAEVFGELMLSSWFSLDGEFASLRFKLEQVEGLMMSHERLTERNTFRRYLSRPMNFVAFSGGATGGIEQMRTAMRPRPKRPHPLNRYPAGFLDPSGEDLGGQPLPKCPGLIWMVFSGHGEKEIGENGKIKVRKGKGDPGMQRGRMEYTKYHWVKEVQSGIERMVPYNKADNDACDADRMVSAVGFALQQNLSTPERMQRELNEKIPLPDPEAPRTGLETDLASIHHTRVIEMQRMQREARQSGAVGGPRRRRGGLS